MKGSFQQESMCEVGHFPLCLGGLCTKGGERSNEVALYSVEEHCDLISRKFPIAFIHRTRICFLFYGFLSITRSFRKVQLLSASHAAVWIKAISRLRRPSGSIVITGPPGSAGAPPAQAEPRGLSGMRCPECVWKSVVWSPETVT